MPVWASNMNRHSSAATTVGIAQGSSAETRMNAPRGGMHHHRERKTKHQLERHADQGERHCMKQSRTETRIVGRLHEVPDTDERRPSQGSVDRGRAALPAVTAIGTSDTSRMTASAGATRSHASRVSARSIDAASVIHRVGPSVDRPARVSSARISRAASWSAAAGGCCPVSARWIRTCRISDNSL